MAFVAGLGAAAFLTGDFDLEGVLIGDLLTDFLGESTFIGETDFLGEAAFFGEDAFLGEAAFFGEAVFFGFCCFAFDFDFDFDPFFVAFDAAFLGASFTGDFLTGELALAF